jgi:hypothetical protein
VSDRRLAAVPGGALLVLSVLGPLTSTGPASSAPAHHVADLILSGDVERWMPRWLGLAVYAVSLAGAGVLIGAGLGERWGRRVTAICAAVAGIALLLITMVLRGATLQRPGWGTLTAALGLVLTSVGVFRRAVQ